MLSLAMGTFCSTIPFDTGVGRAALWLGRLALRPNNGLPNMLRALAGLLSGSGPPEVDDDDEAVEEAAAVAVLALVLVERALVDGALEVIAEKAVAVATLSPSTDDSREDRSFEDRSLESRPFRASAAAPLVALLGDFAEVGLSEGARRVAEGGSAGPGPLSKDTPLGLPAPGGTMGSFLPAPAMADKIEPALGLEPRAGGAGALSEAILAGLLLLLIEGPDTAGDGRGGVLVGLVQEGDNFAAKALLAAACRASFLLAANKASEALPALLSFFSPTS